MTYESTVAAARRGELFCVSRYDIGGATTDLPVSWEEVDRDTTWARSMLAGMGLPSEGVVAFVSTPEEVPWVCPFERAAVALGLSYVASDAFAFDAARLGSYLRRLPVKLIVGADAASLEALARSAPLEQLLGDVHTVLARPDAVDLVRAAGVDPLLWVTLGPAVAVQCQARLGAHVNGEEWGVESVGGELHLTTLGARAHRLVRAPLGVEGGVVDSPCPCGREDPRIEIASLPVSC
jgi:hypothetical protein